MSNDIVIRAEGLGKKYTIGHQSERERYTALRDVMARGARNLWRKTADLARGRAVVSGDRVEEFWALKDVSFEVRRGEVLGIIGRNGAGKSTLLKILSRITEPSEGRVTIKGRVASLLEVGTGFHPELTGRENIYLNGAILGMTRAEIRRKFDEIVDFAGVEKFLDTPVKRYSSGMYVRLAFAVAAHLEPEILVIDEVLAVGDAEFQKKCLGKMGEVAGGGRTVLFVTHNVAAARSLCTQSLLLRKGDLVLRGATDTVFARYLEAEVAQIDRSLDLREDRSGVGSARLTSVRVENAEGGPIRTGCRLRAVLEYVSDGALTNARFLLGVYDMSGIGIFLLDSDLSTRIPRKLPGAGKISCITSPIMATPGQCYVNIALMSGGVMEDYVQYAAWFEVYEGLNCGMAKRNWYMCTIGQNWSALVPNSV